MQQTPSRRLKLSSDDAFFILLRAREFDDYIDLADVIGDGGGEDPGLPANDNPMDAELAAAIGRLDSEALRDLIALIWVGRGDFGAEEWTAARRAAASLARERAADYVAGIPLVSDYLEQGLSAFGHTLTHYVDTH